MNIFHLPDLGEGLPDAEIRQWHVKVGDQIKTDDLLVSMETAKAVVDVPTPRSGIVKKLCGNPGDIIQTGAPLVEFVDDLSQPTEKASGGATVAGSIEVGNIVLQGPATGIQPNQQREGAIKAIPAVRLLAKQLNVDLSTVTPTGANNQITAEDVKQAQTKNPTPATTVVVQGEALRGSRRSMALAMIQSHAEVVPVTLVEDADIDAWSAGEDFTVRVLQAIVTACQIEPALNAHFYGKTLSRQCLPDINIGLALDSAEGLFVPVIKNAHQKNASALRAEINRFKQEVNSREIAPSDLQGGTITLSNFGVFAGRYANPVIVPPCVAILGVGRVRPTVVCVDDRFVEHNILPLSLTFDHRAVTGGEASRFLATLIGELNKDNVK